VNCWPDDFVVGGIAMVASHWRKIVITLIDSDFFGEKSAKFL